MKFLLLPWIVVLLVTRSVTGYAQVASPSDTDSVRKTPVRPPVTVKKPRPRPLNREWAGGLLAYTNGWGAVLEKGHVRTDEGGEKADMFYNVRSYTLELATFSHPKEQKLTDRSDPNNKGSFIFGKTNSFYAFKLGMNFRRMIAGKPEPGTVSIHWVYGGGAAVGLLKPYYLIGPDPATNAVGPIKYEPRTARVFLNDRVIEGAAPFSEGLSEIKIIPGVHARSGLRFDFSRNKKRLLALETGAAVAYYLQPIELMAEQKPSSFQLHLYAGLYFGKRYAGKQL